MPPMILNPDELSAPLDIVTLFGADRPLEIEIGMGKGRFLRERATAFPDRNYLGIEKSKKWLHHAVARFEKAGLSQIRVVPVYVEGFLERFVTDTSVSEYHINFPDPWPKKRHRKRRFIQPQFIKEICRTLRPGGQLHIATDYLDYYHSICEVLAPFLGKELRIDYSVQTGSILSNYHVKYLVEGRPIYFITAVRTSLTEAI